MATTITSECINCGACEPECPNTAIYAGAVAWELNGETHPAIAQDIYYIVPSKCTECVGFHDHEACAAVCPVDCCIPIPQISRPKESCSRGPESCIPRRLFPTMRHRDFVKKAAPKHPRQQPARRLAPR